jgi:hypothetical protein
MPAVPKRFNAHKMKRTIHEQETFCIDTMGIDDEHLPSGGPVASSGMPVSGHNTRSISEVSP